MRQYNDSYETANVAALNLLIIGKAVMLTSKAFNPVAHSMIPKLNDELLTENDATFLRERYNLLKNVEDYLSQCERFEHFLVDYLEISGHDHPLDYLVNILWETRNSLVFAFDPEKSALHHGMPPLRKSVLNQVASHLNQSGASLREIGVKPSIDFFMQAISDRDPDGHVPSFDHSISELTEYTAQPRPQVPVYLSSVTGF